MYSFLNIETIQAARTSDTSFSEKSITLNTPTGNIYGTLCTPVPFMKGSVVFLISGSGPTDRNGNNSVMKNNSLMQLSHVLADSGIASVRFDKRGIGESSSSMKNEFSLTFDDYVNDVRDWIQLLRSDKKYTSVVVAGHSEGSLIGMIAANGNADKYISIAGAGKNASLLIKEQLSTQPSQIIEIAYPIIDSLLAGHTVNNVNPMFYSLFRPSVQPYLISWFKYDPQKIISELKIPTLIIQGDNDLQVTDNDAYKLKESKKDAQLQIINGMNHILKIVPIDKNENISSYSNPSLPISKELTEVLIRFIRM